MSSHIAIPVLISFAVSLVLGTGGNSISEKTEDEAD